MSLAGSLKGLLFPIDKERLATLARRWRAYPASQRSDGQAIGRYVVGCGATHDIHEACNFGCTACYLGARANRQPPAPFERVAEQIDRLRAYLGPGGNIQITSGEVTLLPVENLIRIVRYARAAGLSPMVMTHGDRFLHEPDYLEALVSEGGLRKVSIHVDLTQRGRKGVSRPRSEGELNAVRTRFAESFRRLKRKTGVQLKAATTMTVSRANLDQVGEVTAWFLDHLDAFRILSLQPQAEVGRTRDRMGVAAVEVWRQLEAAVGFALNPHPFHFGHPACNRFALLVAVTTGKSRFILQAVRPGNRRDHTLASRFLRDFGGLLVNERPRAEVAAKLTGALLRKPGWWPRLARYVAIRSWQERRHIPRVLAACLRGKLRVRPFALIVHAFMSERELDTAEGRERLAACVFKLAVGDRMVSMCDMNASGMREASYTV